MDDGEPAFSNKAQSSYWIKCDCGKKHEFPDVTHPGMTLRDYFAAKALEGIISDRVDMDEQEAAKLAYQFADAMLAARTPAPRHE